MGFWRCGKEAAEMNLEQFEPVHAFVDNAVVDGTKALRVVKDPAFEGFDGPSYAKLRGLEFHNGVIEALVLSRLLPGAPAYARGFIGVSFRIDPDNAGFETFYIRPANGRSEDQARRNHATQYFSFPDYKYDRLRAEAPEKYESYADMGLDEWISIKIEVEGERARLFLNGAAQPALVVNDLKHGADRKGAVGLWVETGTEGFFSILKVESKEAVPKTAVLGKLPKAQEVSMKALEETVEFLKANTPQYLATLGLDGDPKVRPFRFMLEKNGRLFFATSNRKQVFKEMRNHPNVEFCVMGKGGAWIRLKGRVSFVEDGGLKKEIFDMAANVRNIYKTPDNPALVVFCLENAGAVIADLSGEQPKELAL
jgi:uncharacterized pyridoxamine 5'-phosphate oxidase family protein